jgi:hypothetical protein
VDCCRKKEILCGIIKTAKQENLMNREMFRQGDVLVVRAEQLPESSEEVAWQDRVVWLTAN